MTRIALMTGEVVYSTTQFGEVSIAKERYAGKMVLTREEAVNLAARPSVIYSTNGHDDLTLTDDEREALVKEVSQKSGVFVEVIPIAQSDCTKSWFGEVTCKSTYYQIVPKLFDAKVLCSPETAQYIRAQESELGSLRSCAAYLNSMDSPGNDGYYQIVIGGLIPPDADVGYYTILKR